MGRRSHLQPAAPAIRPHRCPGGPPLPPRQAPRASAYMSGGVGRRTSGSRLRLSSTGTCGGRTGPSHRAGAEGAQPRLTGAGHGPPPSCQSPGGLEGEPQEPWDAHGLDFEPTVPSHVTEWPSLPWVSNGRRHRSLPQREGRTPDPGPAATHHGLEPARAPGSRPRAVGGRGSRCWGWGSGLIPASGREPDTAARARGAASPRPPLWPCAPAVCCPCGRPSSDRCQAASRKPRGLAGAVSPTPRGAARLTMVAVNGMLSISDDAAADTQSTSTMAAARRRSSGTIWEGQTERHQVSAPRGATRARTGTRPVTRPDTQGHRGPGTCPDTPSSPGHGKRGSDVLPGGGTRGRGDLASGTAPGLGLSLSLPAAVPGQVFARGRQQSTGPAVTGSLGAVLSPGPQNRPPLSFLPHSRSVSRTFMSKVVCSPTYSIRWRWASAWKRRTCENYCRTEYTHVFRSRASDGSKRT